jgi:integrase
LSGRARAALHAAGAVDRSRRHASEGEYVAFLDGRVRAGRIKESVAGQYLKEYRRFVRAYPDLAGWFRAPLPERIGRLYGEGRPEASFRVISDARPYLSFLAARGYAWFDPEWLVAMPSLYVWGLLEGTPLAEDVAAMEAEAVALGYSRWFAERALGWSTVRLFMNTLCRDASGIEERDIDGLEEALRSFGGRADLDLFFGSEERYRKALRRQVTHLQLLRVVLYHRGRLAKEPRRSDYRWESPVERPSLKPRMEAAARRYLATKSLSCRPATVERFDLALWRFIAWVAEERPEVESFAEVDREMVLEYAEALNGMRGHNTGRPLSNRTKEGYLSRISVFFRETAAWGWEGVPGRQLLGRGELPRRPRRIPRFVPEHELARLMEAVRALSCPYQRAAVLIARWSGARRSEIRRLEMDCLDSYPDGTPRLRVPAGKTHEERLIPLNEEAADAIRKLQKLRGGQPVRGFPDELTGIPSRRLFVHRGKTFSVEYLLETSLRKVCLAAGLVDGEGKPTVTSHRLRHTVGTQLAERGARLNTIMRVLGHQSVGMSVVYAQIGDREVLADYQQVLGPGATIAGPIAETLRRDGMPEEEVEWVKRNFFKTELELGRCLRLPQEGPCECELYLNCPKFVTTPEYAPRLRVRREKEFGLIEDAISNGWEREVERHRCTVRRIEQLLGELGEPVEGEQNGG